MKTFQLECGNCAKRFEAPLSEASVRAECPVCGATVWAEAFPALVTGVKAGRAGETVLVDDESACFYHPTKRAVLPCDACGRFLCALCDIEMDGRHLCTACIEAGVRKGAMDSLQTQYVYYDSIALSAAILPLLFLWLTIVSAPIVLFLAIRYWNTSMSVLPRNRWRFVAAVTIAGFQLVGWGLLALLLLGELPWGGPF